MNVLNTVDLSDKLSNEQIEKDLKAVANVKSKNEKLSWSRKQKKIEEMVEELAPLDAELSRIQLARQERLDAIYALRHQMVKECIHPKNSLVHKDNFISCKFCNSRLSIPKRND